MLSRHLGRNSSASWPTYLPGLRLGSSRTPAPTRSTCVVHPRKRFVSLPVLSTFTRARQEGRRKRRYPMVMAPLNSANRHCEIAFSFESSYFKSSSISSFPETRKEFATQKCVVVSSYSKRRFYHSLNSPPGPVNPGVSHAAASLLNLRTCSSSISIPKPGPLIRSMYPSLTFQTSGFFV